MCAIPRCGGKTEDTTWCRAVSYTHLDVYKRQAYTHHALNIGKEDLAINAFIYEALASTLDDSLSDFLTSWRYNTVCSK